MRFYKHFWSKTPQKYDFTIFLNQKHSEMQFFEKFEKTDPAGRPIDRSEKKVGGLLPPSNLFYSIFLEIKNLLFFISF